MRPFLILCTLFVTVSAYAGDGVSFVTVTSWSEALDLAATSGKPIFLDAYTDWCGWCKVMDEETFADPEVAKVMNASFVNVKMEMETGGGVDVAMKYRITGFPTFMVFDASGKPTYKTFGYQSPQDWLATLKAMTSPDSAMMFKGMASGIAMPWPDWHRKAFLKAKLRTRPSADKVGDWFRAQDDKHSEIAFGILMRHAAPEWVEDYVLEHEQVYVDRFGDDARDLRNGFINSAMSRATEHKDTAQLARAKALVTGSDDERELMLLRLDGGYFQRTSQWQALGGVVRRFADRPDVTQYAGLVNAYCWSIYEESDDSAALNAATMAMERVAASSDAEWAHIDTYAALLHKTGRNTDALREAERALKAGTAVGADVSETAKLIETIKAAK